MQMVFELLYMGAVAWKSPVVKAVVIGGAIAGCVTLGYQCGAKNTEPTQKNTSVVQPSPLERAAQNSDTRISRKGDQVYHNGKTLPDMRLYK